MNGADVHDQLRLQSYSIQKTMKFKKYYKGIFLGLIDMALVNAYIVHRDISRKKNEKPVPHGKWIRNLANSLVSVTSSELENDDLRENEVANDNDDVEGAPVPMHQHTMRINTEKKQNGKTKPRVCVVCSYMSRTGKSKLTKNINRGEKRRAYETTYFCIQCSNDVDTPEKRTFHCKENRPENAGRQHNGGRSCSDIWHLDWKCKVPKN